MAWTPAEAAGPSLHLEGWSGLGVPWEMGLPGPRAASSAPALGATLRSRVARLHVGDRGTGLPTLLPCYRSLSLSPRAGPAAPWNLLSCTALRPQAESQKGQCPRRLWDKSTGPRPGDRERAQLPLSASAAGSDPTPRPAGRPPWSRPRSPARPAPLVTCGFD